MSTLNTKDYKEILKYYNIPFYSKKKRSRKSLSNNKIKIIAENILATKLCKCIKKVTKKNRIKEPGAIAICTKSIFRLVESEKNCLTTRTERHEAVLLFLFYCFDDRITDTVFERFRVPGIVVL